MRLQAPTDYDNGKPFDNPSLMSLAVRANSRAIMRIIKDWSIENQVKLPEKDLVLLPQFGLGSREEYLEEFATRKSPQ